MTPPASAPVAAVIIPHYNDTLRLHRCLEALMPQMTGHPEVELVIVDNNSSDDLEPLRQAFPGLRIVTEMTRGAGPARNRGVRETTAPNIFFLDADCVPAEDWLARALSLAGSADLVGGRVDTFDETPAPRSGAEAYETAYAFQQRFYVEQRGFSVTANLLTTRDVFLDTGDFIDGLPEDMEWCQRATGKGYSLIYADTLRVSHPTRSDWSALKRKWVRLTKERQALFGDSPKARLVWAIRSGAVVVNAVLQVPRALRYPGLSTGERMAAIATLFRLTGQRVIWMLRQSLGLKLG